MTTSIDLNIPTSSAERVQEKEHILQFFSYDHLQGPVKEVSKPFCELAHRIVNGDPVNGVAGLPRNPERSVALRKLLEAKDAAVRAFIAK